MAVTVTAMVPTAALSGKGGLRAAGVTLEVWSIVLTNPTTAATVTTTKITKAVELSFVNAATGALSTPTVVNTPLGSGSTTLAVTGLTTDATYTVFVRGAGR